MSGETSLLTWIALSVLGAICSVTDLTRRRIYNIVTLPILALGLITAYWRPEVTLLEAFLGVLAGLGLYLAPYAARWLGAGDVKFLMAVGAWLGPWPTVTVGVLAVVLGSILAVVQLLTAGRLMYFFGRIRATLLSAYVPGLEFHLPNVDRKIKLPFGVPLSIAALMVAGELWKHLV